jgi:very-short-patch-repair endonuclease
MGIEFRRQHGIGPYIVDFYCPERSLVIELDGDSHADAEQIQKDQRRDRYLQSINLRAVRYRNDDIMKNLDGVLEDLQKRVSSGSTSPSPSLSRRGEEKTHN